MNSTKHSRKQKKSGKSSASLSSNPPKKRELEVSIFGPGKGESIAVHLGEGAWIIVDSCVDQTTGSVAVLDYLYQIGVRPEESVVSVVGTHAHDDHIAGLGRVFEVCKSAQFVCSSALTTEEFYANVKIEGRSSGRLRESIRKEYRQIFEEVRARGRASQGFQPIRRAVEQYDLVRAGELPRGLQSRVVALSPSPTAVTRATEKLAIASSTDARSQVPPIDPNELAVAISVQSLGHHLILGADLEKGPAGCGWQAVLASAAECEPAGLFKVPHHGSINAHHDGVWQKLLSKEPVALLAPFRAGVKPLPAPEDCQRICNLAPESFIAASPRSPRNSRGDTEAALAIASVGKRVRKTGKCGQVRARINGGETVWRIELKGPAEPLC